MGNHDMADGEASCGAYRQATGGSDEARGLERRIERLETADGFEERGTEEQIGALYTALAKASGAFTEIAKSQHVKITLKSGGNYEYDYAPLKALIDATRPALSAAGVFVSFPPSLRAKENGVCRLRLMITGHGARLIFTHEFFKAQDIKDYGGQLTYLSRYMFRGCLGLDAGDLDADEVPRERETGATAESAPKRQREAPTPQRQEAKPQQKPPSRPQAAPEPEPRPTPQAKSEPPPAPKPEPSNAELARGLGMPVDVVDVGHQSMVPKTEPRTEVDTDASDFDPRKLSAQELEDAIKVNGRAIGITKAGIAMLYQEVSKNQETTMMNASRTHHEAALLVLMRRRREAEASQSL